MNNLWLHSWQLFNSKNLKNSFLFILAIAQNPWIAKKKRCHRFLFHQCKSSLYYPYTYLICFWDPLASRSLSCPSRRHCAEALRRRRAKPRRASSCTQTLPPNSVSNRGGKCWFFGWTRKWFCLKRRQNINNCIENVVPFNSRKKFHHKHFLSIKDYYKIELSYVRNWSKRINPESLQYKSYHE